LVLYCPHKVRNRNNGTARVSQPLGDISLSWLLLWVEEVVTVDLEAVTP
jgi:hypothetical protein